MGEILRALEGPIAPMICATDDPEHATICDRSSRCTVNVLWVRVRDAVTGALDGMTLADLVPARGVPIQAASPSSPTIIETDTLTGVLTSS
jgi:DNA-binding IscR family transcriptional regulator